MQQRGEVRPLPASEGRFSCIPQRGVGGFIFSSGFCLLTEEFAAPMTLFDPLPFLRGRAWGFPRSAAAGKKKFCRGINCYFSRRGCQEVSGKGLLQTSSGFITFFCIYSFRPAWGLAAFSDSCHSKPAPSLGGGHTHDTRCPSPPYSGGIKGRKEQTSPLLGRARQFGRETAKYPEREGAAPPVKSAP